MNKKLHAQSLPEGNSSESRWTWATSGVPEGFVQGAMFLNIFIYVIDKGIEGILSRFTDVTKQSRAVVHL